MKSTDLPKILLIDDYQLNLVLLENTLKKAKAELYATTSCKEALVLNKKHDFALMILDVMMPEMSGFELAEKLRKNPKSKYTPIIFISAVFTDSKSITKGYKVGAVDFIPKPLNPEILRSKVDFFLLLYKQKQEIIRQHLKLKENIAKRKKVEEALRVLNTELEERIEDAILKHKDQQNLLIQKSKLESLGKIAAGMAHEINQPLAAISMGLDNIVYEQSSGKVTNDYLTNKINTLFEEIEKIKQLIEHVRLFSRDQKSAQLSKVNISISVNEAVSMIIPDFKKQNIALELDLAKTCLIKGNKYKIEQIVLNLLSNSRDAVNEKEGSGKDKNYIKSIKIKTGCKNKQVFLEILDNGIGISRDHMDNIFDPFFTTKSYDKGTGMGLSIVYGIVNELNGEIKVSSIGNEYTKMTIWIPAYK